MKYERIINYRKKLVEKCSGVDDVKTMDEMYSVDTFFEAETYSVYETFAEFCKERDYKRIFDIGSAFGFQSEVFLNEKVEYVGIDAMNLNFWNKDRFEYIVGKYPFKIKANDKDLLVSSLCLGWNCYLYEGEKTLKEQCEAIARDFKSCLLYISEDKVDFIKGFFKSYEMVKKNIYYFSNH